MLGYHVEEVAYCDKSGRRRTGLRYDEFTTATGRRVISVMRLQ